MTQVYEYATTFRDDRVDSDSINPPETPKGSGWEMCGVTSTPTAERVYDCQEGREFTTDVRCVRIMWFWKREVK